MAFRPGDPVPDFTAQSRNGSLRQCRLALAALVVLVMQPGNTLVAEWKIPDNAPLLTPWREKCLPPAPCPNIRVPRWCGSAGRI